MIPIVNTVEARRYKMTFDIPTLQYSEDSLAPHISAQTIKYHYEKHTKKYYDTTNDLTKGTKFDKYTSLKSLITSDLIHSDSKLFNNACQAWNHTFFWESLCPADKSTPPTGKLLDEITRIFGSFETFQEKFTETATDGFGSYWTWLIVHQGDLKIKNTPNAGCPLTTKGQIPLLVVDNWEHSWYLDYPADKPAYLKAIWNIIDWDKVNERFETTS